MNKEILFKTTITFLILWVLIFSSCVTKNDAGTGSIYQVQSESYEQWFHTFHSMLGEKESSLILAEYSEDAILTVQNPYSGRFVYRGKSEIERFYEESADKKNRWYFNDELEIKEVNEYENLDTEVIIRTNDRSVWHGIIINTDENGLGKVSRHLISYTTTFESPASPATAWADKNKDGKINRNEQLELISAVKKLQNSNRKVETNLDEFFDIDGNFFIESEEFEIAIYYLAEDIIRHLLYPNPKLAVQIFDSPVNIHALNWLRWNLFLTRENGNVSEEVLPHKKNPDMWEDNILDMDKDGIIRGFEIEAFQEIFYRMIALYPDLPNVSEIPDAPIESVLKWADVDNDSLITGIEIYDGAWELAEIPRSVVANWEGVSAYNPIQGFFDLDGDLYLSDDEKHYGYDFIYDYLLQIVFVHDIKGYFDHRRAPESIFLDFNNNGEYDSRDKEIIAGYTGFWGDFEEHVVRNEFDVMIDLNKDGYLEYGEFEEICSRLFSACFIALLEAPKEDIISYKSNPKEFFQNLNSQKITINSIESPNSIRKTSFFEKPSTKINLDNKKVAVIGLSNRSSLMNDSKAQLLLPFIEDGFVNSGIVRVMDRQNINKIVDEYNFQASGLVDERTAVHIGQLSGADAIVIACLQNIEEVIYLHLKILSVENGQIIASAIVETRNSNDYRNLCDSAVKALF